MGKFVLKVYRVWYDNWAKEYKKPSLDFAWPIVDSIKLENVDFNGSFHLNFVMDWKDKEKYLGFPSHMLCENVGIYDGANCKQVISFHDERNKVLSQLVIDERPGREKLITEVRPWIELYLAHYKKIACLADLT